MNLKKYSGVPADVNQLLNELREFFTDKDYEIIVRHEPPNIYIIANKSSTWRDWTGTSSALTIKVSPDASGTGVAIGKQLWGKIAIVYLPIILFVFVTGGMCFPVLGFPIFGLYQQYKLTEDTWQVIEKHMASQSGGEIALDPMVAECKNCGRLNRVGGRFCANCGMQLD